MKTRMMKVGEITPADYNPRIALKPGDDEWEALSNSIDRFGMAAPLVYNEKRGVLVSGHQRLNVLKSKGIEEVEVVLISVDEEDEKLLNIALNKVDGLWDNEQLKELFEEFDDDDIKFTGFSTEEVENLFGGYEADSEESGPSYELEDEEPEKPKQEKSAEEKEREFNVYLSFPTKELAEKWLAERDINAEYTGTLRNITIRMEGSDYGTDN